jgi:hypothetical protein
MVLCVPWTQPGASSPTDLYSIPSYKRTSYQGRIRLRDMHGRRLPVGFVRESHPIMGGTL